MKAFKFWKDENSKEEHESNVQTEGLEESGFLLVDKPVGLTSMDVVRVLRRIARPRKIGHGGTLDPFATGVLPILLNQATKSSDDVMRGIKEYEGHFLLGQAYDTQDITGQALGEPQEVPKSLTLEKMQEAAKAFEGEIEQTPPQYSAVKRNGRPLYEYARRGESVKVEPRKVFVEKFEITGWDEEQRVSFYVRSAKGVYVRTLVHDLGQKLGCGAVVESLKRTQTGPFHLDEAVPLSTLKFVSDIKKHLKAPTEIYVK